MTTSISSLVIDDDPLYCESIIKWLKDNGVNQFDTATSAEAGASKVQKLQPTIIFLDNYLPNLNGREVIELYKELSPNSIVVFMSSAFTIQDVIMGIRDQSNYIFNKDDLSRDSIKMIIEAARKSISENTGFLSSALKLFNSKEQRTSNKSIIILEDDPIYAFRTQWLINNTQQDYNIDLFGSITELKNADMRAVPELAILDYNLPDGTNETAIKLLHQKYPSTKIIVHTTHSDHNLAINLQQLGIQGYVIKDSTWSDNLEELVCSILD